MRSIRTHSIYESAWTFIRWLFLTSIVISVFYFAAVSQGEQMAKKKKPSFKDRVCNVVPSAGTERDWTLDDAAESGALGALAVTPVPPPKVDLRAAWWTIQDQSNSGACVGFSVADGLMRYHLVKAGRLAQSQMLSPRFVWMASKETDIFAARPQTFIEEAGTTLKAALDIARKYGCVLETTLPFRISSVMYQGTEKTFYSAASLRRATAYYNLQKDQSQWRTWLATQGPIVAALNVDATWDASNRNAGKLDTYQPGTVRGGHAVTIVGYTLDGRFIIRNSWGTAFGDKGFAYASPAYIEGAFFSESYGVTV